MRTALADRLPAYDPGDSDLETKALRALVAAGLPPPRQQYRMRLRGRPVRIDLAYVEQRIAIELDSWTYHGDRAAFDADRARDTDLVLERWTPLRFTANTPPAQMGAVVRELFDRCGQGLVA